MNTTRLLTAVLTACAMGFLFLPSAAHEVIAQDVLWQRKSSETGHLSAPNAGDQQTCCIAADLDRDGITDFVVGERTQTPSVVWYRSNGKTWDRKIVDNQRLRPEAGGVCLDIDRDGDLDIVLGQDASGAEMWWWENPCPNFAQPWPRRLIKRDGPKKHHDQTAGDFDGDGQVELVSWNQGGRQLLLFELPADPRRDETWPATSIFSWKSGQELEGFPSQAVDIDLDGLVDIVGGGRWFKFQNGQFTPEVIDEQQRFTQCGAGQLVDGGRVEVVFSPGDMDGIARWYQWDNGRWVAHDLGFVVHGHTCDVRDVNQDGHADIFIGEMGDPGAGDQAKILIWYGDGRGSFRRSVAWQGQGIHEGLLADLNGDQRLDILLKPYHHNAPRIAILLNGGTQ